LPAGWGASFIQKFGKQAAPVFGVIVSGLGNGGLKVGKRTDAPMALVSIAGSKPTAFEAVSFQRVSPSAL
jgi:hypothetical protein